MLKKIKETILKHESFWFFMKAFHKVVILNLNVELSLWVILAHLQHEKNMQSQNRLEVELLCSCSLTSKVVQCNAMKFTKNLMRCVHSENTKTLWENRNSPWWNVKGITLMFIQCHAWWLNPSCSIRHNIYLQPPNLTCIGILERANLKGAMVWIL
jgi:CRISPR/Cas system-associated endonuclease Cas3-HD